MPLRERSQPDAIAQHSNYRRRKRHPMLGFNVEPGSVYEDLEELTQLSKKIDAS